MEHHIGLLLTHGMKDGEIMDSSKSEEGTTNVELKVKLLLVSQSLNLKLLPLNNDCFIKYRSSRKLKILRFLLIICYDGQLFAVIALTLTIIFFIILFGFELILKYYRKNIFYFN